MAVIETYRPGPEGADTSVVSNDPATNFGTHDFLYAGRILGDEARCFMRFDIPMKPGWVVVNAIMRLEAEDYEESDDPVVIGMQAHRIGASWNEATMTWNNQPPITGAALSTVNIAGTGTITFNVADALDAWNAGARNNGIRLAYPPGGDANFVTFWSSDNDVSAMRPYLQVTWTAAAPNAPIVAADGFPANETAVLSWRFSHDDPTAVQTAFQIEILEDGDPVFTQSKTTSSAESITLPANTLTNGVEYQWRVKTWGPEDVVGPWSAFDLFTTAERPTVAITSPIGGGTVTTSAHTVTWTYTGVTPQAQYRLRLYELPANALVQDSGIVNSTGTTYSISGLKDNTNYHLELSVWNSAGISNLVDASLNFSVDTVPPATPVITVAADVEAGAVALNITNPAPGIGQVATDHNEVWRRSVGETTWTRIATGVATNSVFQDVSVGAGVEIEYKVIAMSVVDTVAEAIETVTLTLYGVWLHEPADPMGTLVHLYYDGLNRDEQWAPEVEMMRFAGRGGAVAEFGPQVAIDQVEATVQVANGTEDRETLRQLARKRVVVCYRDGQNRKVYGVITNLGIRDEKYGGTANFRLETVDYIETGV